MRISLIFQCVSVLRGTKPQHIYQNSVLSFHPSFKIRHTPFSLRPPLFLFTGSVIHCPHVTTESVVVESSSSSSSIRLGRIVACRVCAEGASSSSPPLASHPRLTLITCGRLLLIDAQRCACMQYSVSQWQRGAAAFVCQGSAAGSGGGGAGGGRLLSCRCWPTKEHECSN